MPETAQGKRYINVPLILIRDVHLNYEEAMDSILSYGIVNSVLKWNIKIRDAARQVVYDYFHKKATSEIKSYMDRFIKSGKFEYDDNYNGFDCIGDPDPEQIVKIEALMEDYPEFVKSAIINAQLHGIDQFFNINGQSKEVMLNAYNRIKGKISEHINTFGLDPHPGLEINLYFDFKTQPPEPELFTTYMAIRSFQGKKKYVGISKNAVLMRMFGAKNEEALENILRTKALKEKYDKYARSEKAKTYHMNQLFDKLLDRGLLRSKIFMRQVSRKIFFSTTLDYDQLSEEIIWIGNKRNHKKKELAAREKITAAVL